MFVSQLFRLSLFFYYLDAKYINLNNNYTNSSQSFPRLSTIGCNVGVQNCSKIYVVPLSPSPHKEGLTPVQERPFVSSIPWIEDAPKKVKDFFREAENIVLILATKAEEAFEQRQRLMKECSCLPNWCSNVLGEDATCGLELGNAPNECGIRQGTMFSKERGMAGVATIGTPAIPGNLPDGLKASICLINHIEIEAVPLLKDKNITNWAYIGTEQGAIYTYPGRVRLRDSETGVELWNYCLPYDPRIRPWYHEGATGPLDIVLVVDVSESMYDIVIGTLTRWDIVQAALMKFVDTLTFTDYFNIVLFNYQGTSLTTGLLAASAENRDRAKDFIAKFSPQGTTNFEAALESAFNAFSTGIESGNTTNCNKVILFLTDGKDNKVDIEQDRTKDILNKVEDLQANLEQQSTKRANIFSFSIGELADDSIPRQLACMHNGSWAPIAAQDDPLTVFNTYLKFVASARNSTRIYWTEIGEDASGLGLDFSAVMPVFTPQNSANIPGALFGVVAYDTKVDDLKKLAGDQALYFINSLQQGSKQCDQHQNNRCLQQVLRGEGVECADLSYQNAACAKFDDKYYKKSQTVSTWPTAKGQCQANGGQLAVPNNNAKQAIVAGVASFEGSWIGLSSNGFSWVWEDGKNLTNPEKFWGYGQGVIPTNEIVCGTIAPSGTSKNIYSNPCRFSFTHICEFQNLPEECGGDFVDLDDPDYYKNNLNDVMPRIQECGSAESLGSIRFLDTVKLPELLPEDLFCHDNFSSPSMIEDFQDLFCCPEI